MIMRESALELVFKHIKIFLATFLITFLVFICAFAAFEKRDVDLDRSTLAREHEILISGQKRLIDNELRERVSDLMYLAENAVFKNYIEGSGSKEDLENEWLLFADKMKKYDQIRYIDGNGAEKVRINFNEGKPVIVAAEALQNKSNMKYFNETMKLDNRNIYRSNFDLNVENGGIEVPAKPMIRFGVPVFDRQGTKHGVLIVNYFGSYVIDNIKRATQESMYMQLVNEKSYWFAGPESNKEWAFMYPDKSENNFANMFPEEWALITAGKNGQFFSPSGLFTFRILEPDVEARAKFIGTPDNDIVIKGSDNAWFLISHVPNDIIPFANGENPYFIALQRLLGMPALLITLIFVAFIFTILFSLYRIENNKLKEIATHDPMTGCLNRRAGTRLLENGIKNAERNKTPLSLLLLDIDHFKSVNDNWGHLVGDRVLKRVARIVKSKVRSTDSVIRTGGEEFLVLLPNTDAKNAAVAAEKLRRALEEFEHPSVGRVTSSFGVAEKKKEESFLQWYKRVDDALYHAKETGRNRVFNADDLRDSPTIATVQLEWNKEWESGNSVIDNQHRELVKLGNELVYAGFSGAAKEEIEARLEEFLNHVVYHFNSEELILNETNYSGAKEHSKIHKLIIADALRLKDSYLEGKVKPTAFFSFIVDDVIVGHMIKEDMGFFPVVREN
ncbi:MAG: diguanylate cyclase [Negativicutes bacterium]|nr:diguanylate cyclase [Negativicutes bacterium]